MTPGLKHRIKGSLLGGAALELRTRIGDSLARLLQRPRWSSLVLGPPKGFYWGIDEYIRGCSREARETVYRVLIPSQEVTIPAPRAIFGVGDDSVCRQLTFRTETGFLVTLPSARYYSSPRSIITADDRLLADVSAWFGPHPAQHWIFRKWKLKSARHLKGNTLSLGGRANYFHFLLDSLPALHLLDLAGQSLNDFDHIITECPRLPFEESLLNHFQIQRHKLVDPKRYPHLLCERLTIPSPGWQHGKWRVDYLERTFGERGIAPRSDSKRVYVSRRHAQTRRVENEIELMGVLRRHGFTIAEMEQLSFYEQVGLFRQAEVVIATEGAALTNLCFCQPGARILMLMSDSVLYSHAAMRLWDLISVYRRLEFYLFFARPSNRDAAQGNTYDLWVDGQDFEAAIVRLLD